MDPVTDLSNTFNSGIRLTDGGSSTDHTATGASSTQGSTFQWKVDVPEFVPRCAVSNSAFDTATASASQWPTSVIRSDLSCASTGNFSQPCYDVASQDATGDVRFSLLYNNVDWVVNELQNNPENFDQVKGQFLDFLQHEVQPPIDAVEAGDLFAALISTALTVPNFAYLCVRLMAYLHDYFVVGRDSATRGDAWFKDALLDSLEKEFIAQKNILNEEINQKNGPSQEINTEQTQRLFIFLNTLCMFATLLNRNGRPYMPLSRAIYELLECMVKRRSDSLVRVVIQTLKTVGAHLESTERMNVDARATDDRSTPLMDNLINCIECIGTENTNDSNTLSENTRFMIRNLRGVRRHWAYVAPPPPSPIQKEPSSDNYHLEDIIPCPDGNFPEDLDASLPPSYLNNSGSAVYYDDPYPGGAIYFADNGAAAATAPLSLPGGDVCTTTTAVGGLLTPAEAAFFEAAAAGVDDETMRLSIIAAGGSVGGGPPDFMSVLPPSLTTPPRSAATVTSTGSDDDVIADAYEEFLRNMQERQTPPQPQQRQQIGP